MFKRCARKWVRPDKKNLIDDYGNYEEVLGHGGCATEEPPSFLSEECKYFHAEIEKLR